MSSIRYIIENIYDEHDRNPNAITYAKMIVEVREMMEDDTISASLICNIYDDIIERDEETFSDEYTTRANYAVRSYSDFFDNEDYEEYINGSDGSDLDFVENVY